MSSDQDFPLCSSLFTQRTEQNHWNVCFVFAWMSLDLWKIILQQRSERSVCYGTVGRWREEWTGGANAASRGWRSPGCMCPRLGLCVPEWGHHGNCPMPSPSEAARLALVMLTDSSGETPRNSSPHLALVTDRGRFPVCLKELPPRASVSLKMYQNVPYV